MSLTGFEHITAPLTKKELELVPRMLCGFKNKIGPGNAITNNRIRKGFLDNYGVKLSGPTVRKLISYIREHHLPNLKATSRGYYLTEDIDEMKKYRNSLQGRVNKQINIIKRVDEFIRKISSGQQGRMNY